MSIKSVMPSNHLTLCCPLLPAAFNLSQHQGLFQWVSSLHQKNWLITWTTALSNSMKLWAMLCRATQDGWVMVESSDKMWSTGEGNGKPLQYSCLENPMNSMKMQKDMTLKKKHRVIWLWSICLYSDRKQCVSSLVCRNPPGESCWHGYCDSAGMEYSLRLWISKYLSWHSYRWFTLS